MAIQNPVKTGILRAGELLKDRYKIVRVIGNGSYGMVYCAQDLRIKGATWAVKELREETIQEPERIVAVSHFKKEAGLLSTLNHTGVPKVIDHFSSGDCHYMVMEFIEGETMEEKLHRGVADQASVVSWAIKICTILEYLHGLKPQPLIYRDLKPSNIMVSSSGRVMLVDFGTARFFNPHKKRDTCLLGTPGFCPPEQYGARQSSVSNDIYALGATMYHMLSGVNLEDYDYRIPPLSQVNLAIPRRLGHIIARCMSNNPGRRFRSAMQLRNELEKLHSNVFRQGFQCSSLAPRPILLLPRVTQILGDRSNRTRLLDKSSARVTQALSPVKAGKISSSGVRFLQLVKKEPLLFRLGVCCFALLFIVALSAVTPYYRMHYIQYISGKHIRACKVNLNKISVALNLYCLDNQGALPQRLAILSPEYIRGIPSCPVAGRVTYGYACSTERSAYTLWCEGKYHCEVAGCAPNFPLYSTDLGVIDNPRIIEQYEILRRMLGAFPLGEKRSKESSHDSPAPECVKSPEKVLADRESIPLPGALAGNDSKRPPGAKTDASPHSPPVISSSPPTLPGHNPLSAIAPSGISPSDGYICITRNDGTKECYSIPRSPTGPFSRPGRQHYIRYNPAAVYSEEPYESEPQGPHYRVNYNPSSVFPSSGYTGSQYYPDSHESSGGYGFVTASDPGSGINDSSFDTHKSDYGFFPAHPVK